MIFNVQLTLRCNLNCSYCQATAENSPFPPKVNYPIEILKNFIEKDPNATIAFYGGEPLLEMPLMFEIMDSIRVKNFILQTNGLFLHKIPPDYVNRFHTILLSIDGRESITDLHRGKETHKKVLQNARLIRKNGFTGELIARMTVSQEMDLYSEVTWLLQLKDPRFDSVHWQLDLMFNDRALWNDLEGWISHQYTPQISALIEDWVRYMQSNKKVLKIYPFLGIIDRLVFKKSQNLHCGAGWIWQNICTDGTIAACPVGADFMPFHIGHISKTHPLDTLNALHCSDPCPSCEIFEICGGRCLYANMFKPWGEDGYALVCQTIYHLVKEIRNIQNEIQMMLESGNLSAKDFDYFKYNCCEIIP